MRASPITRSASSAPEKPTRIEGAHSRMNQPFSKRIHRRQFLAAGAAGLGLLRPAAASDPRPLFEEIPPETSGIRWVHDNAASPDHYLPETMGPGCAFLDYDNDGWMDIYLVNSGPCDFYNQIGRAHV